VPHATFLREATLEDAIAYRVARLAVPCPDCGNDPAPKRCIDHLGDLDLIGAVGNVGGLAELFQWLPADDARRLARGEPLRTRAARKWPAGGAQVRRVRKASTVVNLLNKPAKHTKRS
jgi:hypothetical protein